MQNEDAKRSDEPLAIAGGTPSVPDGPPSWPPHDADIHRALQAAWEDGSWGRYHERHTRLLAERLVALQGTEHVLLCCSGTYAVEAALRGVGVGPGDEVILAGYDFPGNFRAIEAVGAKPALVDIDPKTWSLDPQALIGSETPQTRAVIVSHLHGGLAPMRSIMTWAQERKLAVIEDACQATGAVIEGRPAGSHGDVGVLSFGGSKLVTAGRGGAMLTSRADIYQRAKIYASRGNDAFPLSQLQAAVLLPQLERLAARNDPRRQNALRLIQETGGMPGLRAVATTPWGEASYYKVAWEYAAEELQQPREAFVAAMQAEGVDVDVGFRGFCGRSARRCRIAGSLTHSQRAAVSTVLLHHPVLLHDQQAINQVARAFAKVTDSYGRNASPTA